MDAVSTVGLCAVREKKESSCPGVVKENPEFSKYINITPTLFLLMSIQKSIKIYTYTFLRTVAFRDQTTLLRCVDQKEVGRVKYFLTDF